MVLSVKHFRQYLFQQDLTIVTDHSAIQQVLMKPNPSARISRWTLALSEFQNLIIKHKARKKHTNADALSRPFCNAVTVQSKEETNYDRIIELQTNNP